MLITNPNKANHNNKCNHDTSSWTAKQTQLCTNASDIDMPTTHPQDPQTATTPPTTYVYPDQSGIEAHDACIVRTLKREVWRRHILCTHVWFQHIFHFHNCTWPVTIFIMYSKKSRLKHGLRRRASGASADAPGRRS